MGRYLLTLLLAMQPLQILLKGTFVCNWILMKKVDSKSSDCSQVQGEKEKMHAVEIFVVSCAELAGMALCQ